LQTFRNVCYSSDFLPARSRAGDVGPVWTRVGGPRPGVLIWVTVIEVLDDYGVASTPEHAINSRGKVSTSADLASDCRRQKRVHVPGVVG
jgi:hypothetical protein